MCSFLLMLLLALRQLYIPCSLQDQKGCQYNMQIRMLITVEQKNGSAGGAYLQGCDAAVEQLELQPETVISG